MMNTPDVEARCKALEERMAFQERTLEELNEAVLHQQQRLDQLSGQMAALTRALEQLAEQAQGGDLPHEKPPHY
jgi:SlyX protein